MKISFQQGYTLNNNSFSGDFTLKAGNIALLRGENGVGKSSFIHYLKLNQQNLFPSHQVNFIDQFPLRPLNSISFNGITAILSKEKMMTNIFQDFLFLAEKFKSKEMTSLSGGQNQISKILLGLIFDADVYVFDEPTQYLDTGHVKHLKEIFTRLKFLDKKVLLVEHRSELLKDLIDDELEFIHISGPGTNRIEVRNV